MKTKVKIANPIKEVKPKIDDVLVDSNGDLYVYMYNQYEVGKIEVCLRDFFTRDIVYKGEKDVKDAIEGWEMQIVKKMNITVEV